MAKTTAASGASAKTAPLVIDITPSPEARQALTLQKESAALVITDKATHLRVRQWIVGGKQLRTAIDEHWRKITRVLDTAKKNMLVLKGEDLAPIDIAIAHAERVCINWEDAEARRVAAEERRRREEAEAAARIDREAELARKEEEALEAERSSPVLSKREQAFVDQMVAGAFSPARCAQLAGFKDPEHDSARLRKLPKIIDAIHAKQTAARIREQAAQTRRDPLDVQPIERVEAAISKGAGSRRVYYSAEVVDEQKFLAAVLHGEISSDAIMPRQTYLNQQAKDGPDVFEKAFPGCRLLRSDRIGG